MTSREPVVTVVVAFHDRRAYLGEAVESVLAAGADADLDVVLVDDGSTDGSDRVAASFGPAVRIVRQPRRGCAAAWNAGLRAAVGDLVGFCDSDDRWPPDRLAPMLATLRAEPTVDAVFGCVDEFVSPELDAAELDVRAPRRRVRAPLAGAMLARRALFERVGAFDAALRQGYWIDWYARFQETQPRVVHVPGVVLLRRLHRSNSSVEQRDDMAEFARALHGSLTRRRAAR